MKVLVTGATGFIGKHVVAALLARGHKITAVSRDPDRARNYSWFDRVEFISCDIHGHLDNNDIRFSRNDAVIHLAWSGLPNYRSAFHVENNLPADYRFLRYLVANGNGHLLVSGTCLEYGAQGGCLSEGLPTAPIVPYAVAKDTLRQSLELLQLQIPFRMQWARLFYMYGEGQNPNSLIAKLEIALQSGATEFDMSGGEQIRDYLPVTRVAEYLVRMVENPIIDGIVNVCSGNPISVRQFVENYLSERNARIQLNFGRYPYPDYEPMSFWGCTARLDSLNETINGPAG